MQLFSSTPEALACLVAFVAAAEAVQFTHWPNDAQAGKPSTLSWEGDPNTVRSSSTKPALPANSI